MSKECHFDIRNYNLSGTEKTPHLSQLFINWILDRLFGSGLKNILDNASAILKCDNKVVLKKTIEVLKSRV